MRRARSSAPARSGGVLLAIRAGGSRGRLGVPAAGPAHDHAAAAAWRRRSRPTCSGCSSCRCSAGARGRAASFGTGALAAFVATPCAGPFLGAALGTALLLPLAGSVLVFAALGLGLAIPFLVDRLHSRSAKRAAQAGPVDGAAAALPRHPDGGDRRRVPVAALSAGRVSARCWSACSPPRCCRGAASWPGGRQRKGQSAKRWSAIAARSVVVLAAVIVGAAARRRRESRRSPARSRGAKRWSPSTCSRAVRCSSISPPTGA